MTVTRLAPLSVGVAGRLGDLLNWVSQKRKVHYTLDEGATILTGTLRHVVVGPDNFCFISNDTDVRDAYVRITLTSGVETALNVSQIIELMYDGAFGPVDPL